MKVYIGERRYRELLKFTDNPPEYVRGLVDAAIRQNKMEEGE